MIGYDENQIYYYIIYLIESMTITISRDVEFNENLFTHSQLLNDKFICSDQINYESITDIKLNKYSNQDSDSEEEENTNKSAEIEQY